MYYCCFSYWYASVPVHTSAYLYIQVCTQNPDFVLLVGIPDEVLIVKVMVTVGGGRLCILAPAVLGPGEMSAQPVPEPR